jgi:hypothetical protein
LNWTLTKRIIIRQCIWFGHLYSCNYSCIQITLTDSDTFTKLQNRIFYSCRNQWFTQHIC